MLRAKSSPTVCSKAKHTQARTQLNTHTGAQCTGRAISVNSQVYKLSTIVTLDAAIYLHPTAARKTANNTYGTGYVATAGNSNGQSLTSRTIEADPICSHQRLQNHHWALSSQPHFTTSKKSRQQPQAAGQVAFRRAGQAACVTITTLRHTVAPLLQTLPQQQQ